MADALPVDRALSIVLRATPVLPSEQVPCREALGRILQEEIRADQDYPPFDKSLMDGYAVLAADLDGAPRTLRVVQEIPAGRDPERLRTNERGEASRIMTGAPIPPGADAVLPVEETSPVPGAPESMRANGAVGPGANVARRGDDVREGEVVLKSGDFVGPAEIGVLAACGRTVVRVGRRPRLAVLATGDELLEADRAPRPGQIRNSNGPLLLALAKRAGASAEDLGIAPDNQSALREAIGRGLESDALVISGGVSMGLFDLVGAVLRAMGVEILFEKVRIKPGRPFVFGRRGETLVFGCPGNPASTYVVFQVFARPAIRRMMGAADPVVAPLRGVLETAVRQRPGRTGYYQATARWTGGSLAVAILPTSGSADFVACARGNVLAIVPAEREAMAEGDPIDVILLDDAAER
jgi:molybdopterin molybdotransferase